MIFRLAIITSFTLMLSAPVFAQDSVQDDDFGRKLSTERAEVAMHKYSKCLISKKKREKIVFEYLLIPDGHADQNNVNRKLIVPSCAQTGVRMSFQGTLFRRALYTALYLKNFRKSEPANIDENYVFDYKSEVASQYDAIDEGQLALRQIADCAIRQDLRLAHQFVVAKLYSKEEKSQTGAIVSLLGNCIPKDSKLKFTRTSLKGQLAEALYKLRNVSIASAEAAE